jgi:hypothetical protein
MSETHRITVDPAQCGGRPLAPAVRKSLPIIRCWKPGTLPPRRGMGMFKPTVKMKEAVN